MITKETRVSITGLSDLEEIYEHIQSSAAVIDIECVIRLVELNRRRLLHAFKQKFSEDYEDALVLVYKILYLAVFNRADGVLNLRATNALLYLRESKGYRYLVNKKGLNALENKFTSLIEELPSALLNRKDGIWVEKLEQPLSPEFNDNSGLKFSKNESVAVMCPNQYSQNTIATLLELDKKDVRVSALLVRRMVSIKRVGEEIAFSPKRLLNRVMNELIYRGNKKKSSDAASLQRLLKTYDNEETNAVKLAKKLGARVYYLNNFNDNKSIEVMSDLESDHAIFTGGGILSAKCLESFKKGIIHAHPGILPHYKGMDVVQWAILEGAFHQVGSTSQVMSELIDGGKMIDNFFIDPRQYNSIQEVRTEVVERKIELVVNGVLGLMVGSSLPVCQPESAYQYYLMHPVLEKITASYQKDVVSRM